ncbi:Serine/threonine-protein phosphatase 4 regulatory subunit 4 [Aphelenchoides besseyi]|nr:Serine/threonine-protein phosphatase 4 regulatory subunit 4 [Aphelenchoides besseyi]
MSEKGDETNSCAAETTIILKSSSVGDFEAKMPTEESEEVEKEEEEEEEEEESHDVRSEMSKSAERLAALIASASAEFDLDETALDVSIKDLKTGNLMRKLTVIRGLPDSIRTEGDITIERLIPAIQSALLDDASLDLHAEAIATFRNMIRDRELAVLYPGLNAKLLSLILQFIDAHSECLSGTAWYEILLDIVPFFPVRTIVDLLIPVVATRAEPNRKAQLRSISSRLIERLCDIVPTDCVRKDLAPCAQMLCQDPSPMVRTEVAQQMSVIARSLNNSTDCVSLVLPCLIELCKDDEVGVREAVLNTIAVCLPHLTVESRRTVVIPLLKRCAERALILRDSSLQVVARQLGAWYHSLRELLSPQDERWFYDTYTRMAELCAEKESLLLLSCRRMCAYNFPCFARFASRVDFNERLLPLLQKFCVDPDEEVRITMAAGYHEIVQLRPDEPALLNPFIELIRGGCAEVVQHLTGQLDRTLPVLYGVLKQTPTGPQALNRIQLDRILLGCNRLIRVTGSWRSHEAYLRNLVSLCRLVPTNDLFVSFVPLFKQEVLTARALPCRIAAVRTLLLITRELPLDRNRKEIIDFFTETVAQHESCQRRRLFADAIPVVLEHFSRNFFLSHFFDPLLKLTKDPIWNIRLLVARLFSDIKQRLVYPANEEAITRMERAMRDLLADATSVYDRRILQQYAVEFSRSENAPDEDVDAQQLAEEQKLWTNIEPVEEPKPKVPPPVPPRNRQIRRTSSSGQTATTPESSAPIQKAPSIEIVEAETSTSPVTSTPDSQHWKTNRPEKPKMAIVRPQPQVTVTQRSPSPMPTSAQTDETRKSKLPLATARYYRGSSSPLNSPTSRQPSPSVSRDLTKYRPRTVDARKPPVGLRRSATASNALSGTTSTVTSSNTNSMSRSTDASSGLMTSRSASTIRRPYSLLKVQSSSSVVDRKPGHLSLRVTSMS